ncbi:MAG: Ribose-phosphate pyrophosphokinase [Alphaproteobacteria bacterium MarineAlpha5_Bin8]|nr:MAG: Ribose-phosphate pyrophosphokinase [Alphaproteobacteria bacterium MarineAlpha5_Bin7]PPR47612.1 MAG: Ribose-phosphate pyrophosphokinase [Alphaproteobacteria bacterium MarineAlpha5_Bin8]PPR53374.1 MAG: Ribose-phosphate pyrophosphokinase [Alphaproteobacteria bacterium MarineAlpha5_Bin6]|tara:strand:- start:484 stop:1419 length:936 start_codon:yes stop_codon:yes gene_type:complete
MKIVACNSNKQLAEAISSYIGVKLSDASIRKFADDEIFVEINEHIRGEDVFIIQSTSHPANDHLLELLIAIDAAKRGSARRITAVIPYYGYARQDRKTGPRTPITAKLVANLLTSSGASRVLTMDLHAGQIQGFFDIPLDNIFSAPPIIKDMKKKFSNNENLVICSPDVGGVVRARAFAKRLNAGLAIADKRREKAGESEIMNIIGEVKDKTCILLDDIVDSAGTLCNAAKALKDHGAKEIYSYIAHGVLSGKAVQKITNSEIKELVLTDSIQASDEIKKVKNIRHISIAPLMGEAIKRINSDSSISELFD